MTSRAARTIAKEIADLLEQRYDCRASRQDMERWLLLLCPPKPRRSVSKGTKARRAMVKELDKLCREIVFARDGNKCRRCGTSAGLMDWAHIYSRRFRVTRWAVINSLVLCRKHHLWWHHSPTEAIEWWKGEVGPEAMRRLELMKRAAKAGPPELVKAALLQEKKNLGGVAEKA